MEERVRAATAVLVGSALVMATLTAVTRGVDPTGLAILVLVFCLGALGIAVARRAGGGAVAPATCGECGGLLSPSSPYCKRCGARRG